MDQFGLIYWFCFLVFAFLAIYLDLHYVGRRHKELSTKISLGLTGIWISLALLFSGVIYFMKGAQFAGEFITGYAVELSLSMDNVFVFILIFSYFNIPKKYQHEVLFYGVISAIVMRMLFIIAGVALVEYFTWVFYIFGLVLIYSSYKIVAQKHTAAEISDNSYITWLTKYFKVTKQIKSEHFFVRENGVLHGTPLLIALLVVEKADLVFAIDSVPAVIAITREPFIAFTSNVFAIIGLRTLYFVLANLIDQLAYLKYGLCFILFFIGCKMVLLPLEIHISTMLSLSVILLSLLGTAMLSLIKAKN